MSKEKPKESVYQWLKWRWEFMRRNSEYRKDFNEVKQNWKRYNWEPFPQTDTHSNFYGGQYYYISDETVQKSLYLESSECEVEKILCDKWGLKSPPMLDPDESFDELYYDNPEKIGDIPQKYFRRWHRFQHVTFALESNAVTSMGKQFLGEYYQKDSDLKERRFAGVEIKEEKLIGNHLVIHIDFATVNSLVALKAVISDLIESHIRMFSSYREVNTIRNSEGQPYKILYDKNQKPKDMTYLVDYDVILKAGDMANDGVKIPKIAKVIFPNDFRNDNDETAIRKVRQYIKKYRELVNGGYINLTFP